MNTRMTRRLAKLEAATPRETDVSIVSIDLEVPWLAPGATLWRAVDSMAMARARRRAIAEGAYTGFGYFPEPADARIRAELADLDRRWAETRDLIAALAAWCDEPDEDGWPPRLCDPRPAGTPASAWLWQHFRRERQRLDAQRGSGQWARWRAAHPEWSPAMSDAEYVEWDLSLWRLASHEGRR